MSSPPTLPESAYGDLGLSSDTVKILTKPQKAPATVAAPNVLQAEPPSAKGLAMNETSITLYAELLLNIRTVTLFASLRTVHTRETKAKLSTDGYEITVTHEGESATIRLPVKAQGGGDAALSLPATPPGKEMSLRLQIEEQDGSELFTGMQAEERRENIVPWDGASLNTTENVKAFCKSCSECIVPSGRINEWRDLPNENWAEMMDFWHCHKPDEHHLHDHTHHDTMAKKGYAASNRLKATKGVGFVDLATLLLKEEDCESIQTSNSELKCRKCNHALGTVDDSADGWRIWKWCIDITTSSSTVPPTHTYSTQKWISARLLFLIENQGIRKFHVHDDTSTEYPVPSLLIWVFTPDLLFSSSIPSKDRLDPTRAMKVFYKNQSWSPPQPGEPESASIEEVTFPKGLFEELRRALEAGKKLLPVGARMFQGWEVGLLERFDVGEIKGTVRESTE